MVEVEKDCHLRLQAVRPRLDLLLRIQLAFSGLTTRISDETGAASDEDDGPMTGPLNTPQREQRKQATDMQAIRGGIKPDVHRARTSREMFAELIGLRAVRDEAPPREIVPKVNGRIASFHVCIIATYGGATQESSG